MQLFQIIHEAILAVGHPDAGLEYSQMALVYDKVDCQFGIADLKQIPQLVAIANDPNQRIVFLIGKSIFPLLYYLPPNHRVWTDIAAEARSTRLSNTDRSLKDWLQTYHPEILPEEYHRELPG